MEDFQTDLLNADRAPLRSPERHQKLNNGKPPMTHHFGINPNQTKRSQGSILRIKDRGDVSESSIWIPLNRSPTHSKNQKVRFSDMV